MVTLPVDNFTNAFINALKTRGVIPSTETPATAKSRSDGHTELEKEIRRASKLAFETMDEVYITRVLDDLADYSTSQVGFHVLEIQNYLYNPRSGAGRIG